jgi:hypothetical protein
MVATGTFLGWLDAHSATVTALATVLLALITVAYVRVSYQLVSAERLQAETPEVVGSLTGTRYPDIYAKNVGKSAAAQLALLRGPGDGIAADIEMLGVRKVLLPGEDVVWEVRPPKGTAFEPGDLPLTIIYFDNNLATLYFKVMVIRFEGEASTSEARSLGFVAGYCSARDLRQCARREMSNRLRRVSYSWRTRKEGPTQLILDEETRAPLRVFLAQQVKLLNESDPKLLGTRTAI